MLDLAPAPPSEPQARPAQSWRNYYRVYRVLRLMPLGTLFPGLHAGPASFASKQLAERHAENLLKLINPPGRFLMDHAGAYPEGGPAN